MTFSSDLVFDGRQGRPLIESDLVSPIGVYGHSKAEAESLVLSAFPEALVIRTSAFFGPWDRYSLLYLAMRALSDGRAYLADGGIRVSPTFVRDLANATLDLLLDRAGGVWHVANSGCASWYEFLRAGAQALRLDTSRLQHCRSQPSCTALASERGLYMPDLESGIRRFADSWKPGSYVD